MLRFRITSVLATLCLGLIMADETSTTSTTITCDAAMAVLPKKVVVTGAGGQTGQALFRKLLAQPKEFEPLGFVRTAASKETLVASGVPAASVAVVDVTDASAIRSAIDAFTTDQSTDTAPLAPSSSSLTAFCICTSAKPKPIPDQVNPDTGGPVFGFPDGSPEQVDWLGQKQQMDACPPGTHIVVCSSMDGTNPDSGLNALGRETLEDGTVKGGNILLWKRKAELYLIDLCESSNSQQQPPRTYTIVHPGGLINEPGGEREIVVGVDDEEKGNIPREDVAQVMLSAVRYPTAFRNRSFDIRAKPLDEEGGSVPTTDQQFETLVSDQIKDRNCDYTLGKTM